MKSKIPRNPRIPKIPQISKESYQRLIRLAPIMETSRIIANNSSIEVKTCNNLYLEDQFITKESRYADKLWNYFVKVKEKEDIPNYFHKDGIHTILIGNNLNDAYHLAAELVPIGVEGRIYLDEDYYSYDGGAERREQGVSIGTLDAYNSESSVIFDEISHIKGVTDSVMITGFRESQAFDIALIAKTYLTNTFISYSLDAYDDYAKGAVSGTFSGAISKEELIEIAMKTSFIRKLVYEYGFDIMIVPPKTDEDYLELLREAVEDENLTMDDLQDICEEIGDTPISEEKLYNYLHFITRDTL